MSEWTVNYNETRQMWMIWSDDSPAICYCYVEADAERIARLLNERVELHIWSKTGAQYEKAQV